MLGWGTRGLRGAAPERGRAHTQRQAGVRGLGLSERPGWGCKSTGSRTASDPSQVLFFERVKVGDPGEASRSECGERRGETDRRFGAGERRGQVSATQRSSWRTKWGGLGRALRGGCAGVWFDSCAKGGAPGLRGCGGEVRKARARPDCWEGPVPWAVPGSCGWVAGRPGAGPAPGSRLQGVLRLPRGPRPGAPSSLHTALRPFPFTCTL